MLKHNLGIRLAALSLLVLVPQPTHAAPPTPTGQHPRLFLNTVNLAVHTANAKTKGTAAESIVANCQEAIDKPEWYTERGGADGSTWPAAAVDCAFAYVVTQDARYLTQAIKFWNASLNDDQTLGDGKGCVAGASTDWQTWAKSGNGSAPPVILTITHDTGYPMRWYGPFVALTYDWLHDAPGVDEALRAHTRACLTNWVDYYTKYGYHHDEPGANYGAGYVIAKALTSVAFGGENGADGDRQWAEAVDDLFGTLLIGRGLAGSAEPVGKPAGVLVGGDWGEGWQYGPLSVLEYAAAARALEEAGAQLPAMDAWTNSLVVRAVHASAPALDGMFNANGDLDSEEVYPSAAANLFDAVLLGPSSDEAAAWATFEKQALNQKKGDFIWNALAEARTVAPEDYRAQSKAAPLWYLARGTRTVFARTAWDASAFWGVFSSPPQVVSDHHHFSATNFVFSRGSDHLIVDPSNYGEPGTLETNAASADSKVVTGDYAPSQTPWSKAELLWARGSSDAVYAARGDFADAFVFSDTPSDIPFARRDWVMLPEGEIVLIDRVQTIDAAHQLYVNLHTNTGGSLKMNGAIASGTVGSSQVAIHGVFIPNGSVKISQPPVQNDYEYPCGSCSKGRFAVDNYGVKVPGPRAVAVHVIDGLAANESPAEVGSLNDENFDPAQQNTAVLGAAVYRAAKQSYVVASSAQRGEVGAAMTYGVPGGSAARHVVFDAPEQADGRSNVTAIPQSGRCIITITTGAGFEGRPLMFSVSSVADGCHVSEDTNVPPGVEPPGGGVSKQGSGATYDAGKPKDQGGCGCVIVGRRSPASRGLLVAGATVLALCRLRRRASQRPSRLVREPPRAKDNVHKIGDGETHASSKWNPSVSARSTISW